MPMTSISKNKPPNLSRFFPSHWIDWFIDFTFYVFFHKDETKVFPKC